MALFTTIKEEINNLSKLLNPYKANDFLEKMEVKSVSYMFRYLIFMGLFLFAGYSLNLYYKTGFEAEIRCSLIASLESAFVTYIVLVFSSVIAGYIISAFGKSLVGRDIDANETVSVIGYPLAIILFSGIFRAHLMTIVLYYILIVYGVYLLYAAIRARFGFERSLICFMFFLIVISLVIMILFQVCITLLGVLSDVGLPLRPIPSGCH